MRHYTHSWETIRRCTKYTEGTATRERESTAGGGGDGVNMDVNADEMQPNVHLNLFTKERKV